MPSNYFECCPYVNPMDSVPEELSNIIKYNEKQDVEIAKKVNKDDLSEVAKSGLYGDLIDKPVALPNPQPITINGQRYDGSEAVTVTVSSEGGGTPVEIDDTLTQSGKAADAKAVGDRLSALNEAKANNDDLAKVAKSGSYNDLSDKPTIPTVPTTLPNPNKLKLTGAVTAEYDGSEAVSVEIPEGVAGGIYPVVSMTDATAELAPNTFYRWGEIAALSITLETPTNEAITNEYCFEFVSGSTATTLTVPDTIRWAQEPSIDTGKTYQVSILNGIGVIVGA